jgi:hypothetical protein
MNHVLADYFLCPLIFIWSHEMGEPKIFSDQLWNVIYFPLTSIQSTFIVQLNLRLQLLEGHILTKTLSYFANSNSTFIL